MRTRRIFTTLRLRTVWHGAVYMVYDTARLIIIFGETRANATFRYNTAETSFAQRYRRKSIHIYRRINLQPSSPLGNWTDIFLFMICARELIDFATRITIARDEREAPNARTKTQYFARIYRDSFNLTTQWSRLCGINTIHSWFLTTNGDFASTSPQRIRIRERL